MNESTEENRSVLEGQKSRIRILCKVCTVHVPRQEGQKVTIKIER